MALDIQKHPVESDKPGKTGRGIDIELPGFKRGPGSDDRMFFTEQLALLLETGESLYGALTTIVRQTKNPKMREIVEDVARSVSEGQPFGKALEKHDEVF